MLCSLTLHSSRRMHFILQLCTHFNSFDSYRMLWVAKGQLLWVQAHKPSPVCVEFWLEPCRCPLSSSQSTGPVVLNIGQVCWGLRVRSVQICSERSVRSHQSNKVSEGSSAPVQHNKGCVHCCKDSNSPEHCEMVMWLNCIVFHNGGCLCNTLRVWANV